MNYFRIMPCPHCETEMKRKGSNPRLGGEPMGYWECPKCHKIIRPERKRKGK